MSNTRFWWTLRGQLTIAFAGVLLAAMAALVVIVPGLARQQAISSLEGRLLDEARLVADYAGPLIARGESDEVRTTIQRLGRVTQIRLTIIAPDGRVIADADMAPDLMANLATRRDVRQALTQGQGLALDRSGPLGVETLYASVLIWTPTGEVIGVARAALPTRTADQLVDQLISSIVLVTTIVALLAVGVAHLAARTITRPLARLTHAAGLVAEDPLRSRRVPRHGGPVEVAELAEALDDLATAVRDSLTRVGTERDRLDAVLANLADGVVIVDAAGYVTRLNAAAARLLGTRPRGAPAGTVVEVLRDHELVRLVEQVGESAAAQPPVATAFLELRNPRRFLRALASRFGTGGDRQTLVVLQDLTEIRRLETVRRDFVANVSHELRTPIAAIKAMTETLQDGAIDDRDAAIDFLARIEQEVDGLHRLVEELLELSRLESGRVTIRLVPTDPAQLVTIAAHRLRPMAERSGVELAVALPPDLPVVSADAERMGHVMTNLIHNAIKFTPPGGRIVISGEAEDSFVRLAIADTGIGIPANELPRVFERFFKVDQARSDQGTGLGLAIAKHTVQLHGGEIWGESGGPGRGTTIHVRLPRAPAAQAVPTPA